MVVLKPPADFVGQCRGKSEMRTEKIFEAAVDKVLLINEANMLEFGDPDKEQDKFL